MFACVCVHELIGEPAAAAERPSPRGTQAPGEPGLRTARPSPEDLSLFAREYSPRVEPAHGVSVVFDASGLERLFGGPRQLAAHVEDATRARGWRCGVALAHTRTTARLLAHAGPGQAVVASGREAHALSPLPIALLALADEMPSGNVPAGNMQDPGTTGRDGQLRTVAPGSSRHYRMAPLPQPHVVDADALPMVETLRRWGLVTIGDLAVLPRAGLHSRFGEAGVRWHRLAHGDDLRPLVREAAEEPYTQVMSLEWPIEGLEPLSFVVARLLEPLCARLDRRERGAVGLRLWLRLVTRVVRARYLQLPAPIRDAKVLRTLLLLHLESHPPEAGIDEVTLTFDIAPGRIVQHSLLTRPLPTPDHVSTLVARLTALMGEGRCGQPQLVDSLRPGAYAMAPFSPVSQAADPSAGRLPGSPGGVTRGHRRSSAAASVGQAGSGPVERPAARDVPAPRTADDGQRHACQGEPAAVLRRYRRPWPVRVTTADDGRPVRMTCGQVAGGTVRERAGPWRTSGEWWHEPPPPGERGGPWDREEWDVAVDDGTVYRVSRDVVSGTWVVEGYWD